MQGDVAMNRLLFKDSSGWGFILWLIGYIFGIALIFVLPAAIMGWIIMPIGVLLTLWVLLTRVKGTTLNYFVILALIWMAIAIVFDYLFIVRLFKPVDEYYKLDVVLYYILTLVLPLDV